MKQENLEWMVTTICHLLLPGGHKNTKESTSITLKIKRKLCLLIALQEFAQHLKYTRKSAGSMQDMYLVAHEINDAILGLLNEETM